MWMNSFVSFLLVDGRWREIKTKMGETITKRKRRWYHKPIFGKRRITLATLDDDDRLKEYLDALSSFLSTTKVATMEEGSNMFTSSFHHFYTRIKIPFDEPLVACVAANDTLVEILVSVTDSLNAKNIALSAKDLQQFCTTRLLPELLRNSLVSGKFSAKDARTVGNGVLIKPSTLGAHCGNGLFADQLILKNQCITLYDGEEGSFQDAKDLEASGKATHVRALDSHHSVIIGLTDPNIAPGRGGGSFSNDARDPERNNAKFKKHFHNGRSAIYLQAARCILPGEEVFVSYGTNYWKRRITPIGSRKLYSRNKTSSNTAD